MANSGRPDPVYRITGVRRGLAEDQAQRSRRYLISMTIRTICFLAAVVATGWLRWALIGAAVVLPYLAVVFANAGRERSEVLETGLYLRPDPPGLSGVADLTIDPGGAEPGQVQPPPGG